MVYCTHVSELLVDVAPSEGVESPPEARELTENSVNSIIGRYFSSLYCGMCHHAGGRKYGREIQSRVSVHFSTLHTLTSALNCYLGLQKVPKEVGKTIHNLSGQLSARGPD